ncbi:MAG: hypothetical protein CMO80_18955 [Verrucomicrobiales bacterium]|nr:hypothetical protein [Verrucomicrobiales bacterium]
MIRCERKSLLEESKLQASNSKEAPGCKTQKDQGDFEQLRLGLESEAYLRLGDWSLEILCSHPRSNCFAKRTSTPLTRRCPNNGTFKSRFRTQSKLNPFETVISCR